MAGSPLFQGLDFLSTISHSSSDEPFAPVASLEFLLSEAGWTRQRHAQPRAVHAQPRAVLSELSERLADVALRQEPCPQTTHLSPDSRPVCLRRLTPSALCSLHLGRLLCLHLSWQQDTWPGHSFLASFLFPQAGVGKLLPNSFQSLLGDGPWAKNRFYIFKGLEKLFKKMEKLATETICSQQNLKHSLSGRFHKRLPSLPQREVSRANGISAFVLAGTRPLASSKFFSCC